MSIAVPRRIVPDVVVAFAVGATVFAFAAGSSSVHAVKTVGLDVRWAMLAALAAVALGWSRGRRPAPGVAGATAGLLALALLSSLWSVAPRSSVEHALSLVLLLVTVLLLTAGAGSDRASPVLLGLMGGAVAVAVAGAVLLAASYGTAVVAATLQSPARFRGFGEDPNTVALLLALAVPLALSRAIGAPTRLGRVVGAGALLLFAASIVGSGSRGGLLAATAGAVVTVALRFRGARARGAAIAAVAVLAALGAVLQSLPREATTASASPAATVAAPPAKPGYTDVQGVYPLDADIGRPLPGGGEPSVQRSYLGGSGRGQAWLGALEDIAARPLLGYGFGTEGRVFVDRYYYFVASLPENSYIGIALQLGIVGLLALLGLVAFLAVRGRSALRSGTVAAAASAGVVAAGLTIAVVQSYLYSVGNLASATFWIAAFMLPALGLRREPA